MAAQAYGREVLVGIIAQFAASARIVYAPTRMRSWRVRSVGLVSLAFGVVIAGDVGAVGTRTFELDTLEKLSGGDLKGVAVGSDGAVRAGWTLGNVALPDASACFSALPLADGSVLVGTSPSGKVLRVAGDQATLYADTKALAVTSMVQSAAGVVYAATIPDGKIVKITNGKVEPFASLPDTSHVWALAMDKAKTTLFAATGPVGKVFRIDASGTASVLFQSDEPHLVSLAVAPNGDVYAGSSGKGILYKITGPGRAEVLYDFVGEEVKAIALGANDSVWAIANDYGEPPELPRRLPTVSHGAASPTTSGTVRPKPGKGVLVRFDGRGRPELMMKHGDTHYMALALDDGGQPFVGTGVEGRVYTVDDAHAVTLMADLDDRMVGALAVSGLPKKGAAGAPTGPAFVCGSDGANLHRIVSVGGADAVWTSKPLDAGLRARFGALGWRASGALELSTRTGNTEKPDPTWSAWSNPLTAPGAIQSPAGRYVQVRARWARDAKAVLTQVAIPFVTDNLRPVVLEVSAAPKSGGPSSTKEGIQASGNEVPKHDSVLRLTWRVDNADQDTLRYRVSFRRDEQTIWREVLRSDEVLTKSEYDWDTAALPEGRYRLRVEASDEIANPPDQVQRHALESGVVLVDNTPPTVTLAVAARRLKARVVDVLGPIARAEVAIDGRLEWRPLAPTDGVYDAADESFDADLSALMTPGPHIVALRAYDAAGNVVVREVEAP